MPPANFSGFGNNNSFANQNQNANPFASHSQYSEPQQPNNSFNNSNANSNFGQPFGSAPPASAFNATNPPAAAAAAAAPKPAEKAADKAKPAEAPVPESGLFGFIRSKVLKIVAPDAHEATQNLGDKLEAYFDKSKNTWVFPGQENEPAPAALAPPPTSAMPMSAPQAAPAAPAAQDDDPLAALMAPPSRGVMYSAPQSDAGDPMAALMAPPSRFIDSAPMVASGPPPPVNFNFNMWKPAPGTAPVTPMESPFITPPVPEYVVSDAPPMGQQQQQQQQQQQAELSAPPMMSEPQALAPPPTFFRAEL